MRRRELVLMPALVAALALAGAAVAQPPDQGPARPREPVPPTPVTPDDVVRRLMSFDKNKDGKVTREELPERMQFLIEMGDTNKDGALDGDEIRKLATSLAAARRGLGIDGFPAGPGPGAIDGQRRVEFFPVPNPGPGPLEGVVEELKLSGKKKDQARAVVKAHQEKVRKLMDEARADMLARMKAILSAEEFEDFKAALDRPRRAVIVPMGPAAPQDGRRPEVK